MLLLRSMGLGTEGHNEDDIAPLLLFLDKQGFPKRVVTSRLPRYLFLLATENEKGIPGMCNFVRTIPRTICHTWACRPLSSGSMTLPGEHSHTLAGRPS